MSTSRLYTRIRKERPELSPLDTARVAVYFPRISSVDGGAINPVAESQAMRLVLAIEGEI